jgi:hypothetical protein
MVNSSANTTGSLKMTYPQKLKEQYRIKGWQRPRGMSKRNPLKTYLEQMTRGTR